MTAAADPVTEREPTAFTERQSLAATLRQLKQRWAPSGCDEMFASLAQQRADALWVLFLRRDVHVTTEIVLHIRGDGVTFDDGTPITTKAVARQLDGAFIRLLLHDTERRPVNASHRRRHLTMRPGETRNRTN